MNCTCKLLTLLENLTIFQVQPGVFPICRYSIQLIDQLPICIHHNLLMCRIKHDRVRLIIVLNHIKSYSSLPSSKTLTASGVHSCNDFTSGTLSEVQIMHRSTIANTTDTIIISFPCSFSITSLNIQRVVWHYSTSFLITCQRNVVSISRLKIL